MKLFKLTVLAFSLIALAACLLIGWTVFTNRQGSIIISPATTFIVDPLTEDGLPDYSSWMLKQQRASIPTEGGRNGAIPFWQATWPGDLSVADQKSMRRALGNEIASGPGTFHQDLQHELVTRVERWLLGSSSDDDARPSPSSSEQLRELAEQYVLIAQSQPYTARQIPPIAGWIDANQRGFELLESVAKCDYFYSPSPTLLQEEARSMIEMALPIAAQLRPVHRFMIMRVYYLLGQKQYDAAWDACMAARNLVDRANQHSCLVEELVEQALRGQFFEVVDAVCSDPDVPLEILERMQTDLADIRPIQMAPCIDSLERVWLLDAIIRTSRGESIDWSNGIGSGAVPRFLIDWNFVLTQGNRWYDRLTEAAKQESWVDRHLALQTCERDVAQLSKSSKPEFLWSTLTRNRRSEMFSNQMLALWLPAITSSYAAQDRCNTGLRLRQVAVELVMFRQRHGDFPETLDAVAGSNHELPVDLFYGKSFEYRRTRDGFLLYSRGPNGTNDDGNNHQMNQLHGFRIDDENNSTAKIALSAEFDAPLDDGLTSLIPESTDDIAIRLPVQKAPLPKKFAAPYEE